eukprot:m.307803 g.307803  ORF g.307803 m.307803 type:complete len:787 (+) comp42850_c0_seq1:144-2504(+)
MATAAEMMVPVESQNETSVDGDNGDGGLVSDDGMVMPGDVQDGAIIVEGPDEVIETDPVVHMAQVMTAGIMYETVVEESSRHPNDSMIHGESQLPHNDNDLDDDEEVSNDEDEAFLTSSEEAGGDIEILDDGSQPDDDDYCMDDDDEFEDDDYIEEEDSAEYKTKRRSRRFSTSIKKKVIGMYKCSECYKSFTLFDNLQKHSRLHTAESPFACQICHKPFTKPSALERHMRTHTGERPYLCTSCGKAFTRRSHLQRHAKLHYSVRPFRCSECRSAFSREQHLIEHKTIHMSSSSAREDHSGGGSGSSQPSQSANMEFLAQAALLAGAEFLNGQPGEKPRSLMYASRDTMMQEQAVEAIGGVVVTGGRFKCRRCAKTFSKLGSLEKHAILHTDQSPFKCQHCHRGFPKPSVLKRHMNVHAKEAGAGRKKHVGGSDRRLAAAAAAAAAAMAHAQSDEDGEEEEEEGQLVVDEDDLEEDEEEGVGGRKKFKCDVCWQAFVFEENMVRHRLKHGEGSPFKCPTCCKLFTTQSRLARHEKVHQAQAQQRQGMVGNESSPMMDPDAEVDGNEEGPAGRGDVSRDINDDVVAILAASSNKNRTKQRGKTSRRSGWFGKRRGKRRKVLYPKTKPKKQPTAAKRHCPENEELSSANQITSLDNQQKSPVSSLHISSVGSVEVPLPTAAPPEQLMDDSPPPAPTEEEVVVGEDATIVEDTSAHTQVIDVGGSGSGDEGGSVKEDSHDGNDGSQNHGGHVADGGVNLDEMMISAPFETSTETSQSGKTDSGQRNELL